MSDTIISKSPTPADVLQSNVGRPGQVKSVFGRIDDVVAAAGDYDAFYVQIPAAPSGSVENQVAVFDEATGSRVKAAAGIFAGAGIVWVQSQGPTNAADFELHSSGGAVKAFFSFSELLDESQLRSETDLIVTAPNGNVKMPTIPAADPVIAGALWNDSGTLKVSTG